MNVTINNYRGLSSATLDLSRICLLAGPNEAGKTSAAQALAAALTGDPIPIVGVKKTQAGMLIRSGTANGSVELTGETGTTNIQWPGAKVKTEGRAPFASHFAAGLQSIATMDEKDRPKVLAEYLKSAPTRADLDVQLASMKLPVTTLDQLWELIEKQGWDNAHSQIKEKGARLKGQWQEVTGEQYGSKKAESWLPDSWEQDLMGQSETTLKAHCTDARDALEATIATDAVDESKLDGLRMLAALIEERTAALAQVSAQVLDPALAHQLVEGQGFVDSMAVIRDGMNAALKELPRPDNTFHLPCPACGVALELEQGKKLCIATVMSDEEKATRSAAIEALQKKITVANDGLTKHMTALAGIKTKIQNFDTDKARNVTEATRLVAESKRAANELAVVKPPVKGTDITFVEQCRTTLARADERLQAFVKKTNSDRIHVAIGLNQELIGKIAPEGIRGDVLAKALKGFNEKAVPLSKAASWRPVTLESDFGPCYGGTIYLLLSESAKFRVRTILQLTMALMDRSEAVIVDAADILDKGGRNGLFKALRLAALPALVCMTIDKYADKEFPERPESFLVPNLGKAGIGASYWIRDAVAEVVG
jgi:hypothetical protein